MAFGEGKNRRQTTVGKGALGRGMRIATGAERPRNDIVFYEGCGASPGGPMWGAN